MSTRKRLARPDVLPSMPKVQVSDRARLALLIAFVSGLTSLGYQVTWTRLLASGTGNTTYVFTMILGVFLIGIALGAVIFNLVRSRIGDPLRFLAGAQLTVAALAFASLLWLLDNPNTFVPSRPARHRRRAGRRRDRRRPPRDGGPRPRIPGRVGAAA